MPLMRCPERGCENQVSTSAESCPRCGFHIQNYFQTSLDESSVGIPLDPVGYWNNWHFWYLWGCPGTGPDLEYTNNAWIDRGDLLFNLGSMQIFSPFSGLGVNNCSRFDVRQVGGNYSSGNFFELRILRGTFHEDIGYIYSSP